MHLDSARCHHFSFGRHPPATCHLPQERWSPCRGRGAITRSQECQRVLSDHRSVWRSVEMAGGWPPPRWCHLEAEYFSVTSQTLCPENMWGFTGNTLHYMKQGVKGTYLPQRCNTIAESGGVSPWKDTEKFSHSVDLWGYRNCKRY